MNGHSNWNPDNDDEYRLICQDMENHDFESIDREMYAGFIYVTINKNNGRKYVGQHTSWMKAYLGSGTVLAKAIKKHGKESFERRIIHLCKTYEDLEIMERHYINTVFDAVKDRDWYNLKDGGYQGNPYAGYSDKQMNRIRKMRSEQMAGSGNSMFGQGHKITGDKNGMRTKSIDFSGSNNPFFGKKHSKKTLEKISKTKKENPTDRTGAKNSMYGKFGKDNPNSKIMFAQILETNEVLSGRGADDLGKKLLEKGYSVPRTTIIEYSRNRIVYKKLQIKFWREFK